MKAVKPLWPIGSISKGLKITELLGIDESETCLLPIKFSFFYALHVCIAFCNVPCIEMKL